MKRRFFIFFLVLIYLFNNIFVSTTLGKFVNETNSEKFDLTAIALSEETLGEPVLISKNGITKAVTNTVEHVVFDIYSRKNYSQFIWENGEIVDENKEGLIRKFVDGKTVYFLSKNIIQAPIDCDDLFYNKNKLKSIIFNNFDTSNVTSMYAMFSGCSSLEQLDLSNFNTSKVTNMNAMFSGCSSLKQLNVSSFDTANVNLMVSMFEGCSSLTSLDVSNFDTSNVTDMNATFSNCSSLVQLDVSNFNTSKVTNMAAMFESCSSLTSLDVSNFDTSKVYNMNLMFGNCSNLTTLNVSNFDTSSVASMMGMFTSCSSLTELDLSNFIFGNNTNANMLVFGMFYNCKNLVELDLSGFDFRKPWVTHVDFSSMFANCENLKHIYVNPEGWTVVPENYLSGFMYYNDMFLNCSKLPNFNSNEIGAKKAYVGNGGYLTSKWDVTSDVLVSGSNFREKLSDDTTRIVFDTYSSKYSNFSWNSGVIVDKLGLGDIRLFNNGTEYYVLSKETIDTIFFNIDCYNMFHDLKNLTDIDFNNICTEKVLNMYMMFSGCSNLTELDLSNFDTSNVTSMYAMFNDCSSLEQLDLSNFNTSKVTTMHAMFSGCSNLTELDLSNFDTSNVTSMYGMFNNCSSLTELNVSSFDTSNVTNMFKMFSECKELTQIDISNFDTTKVTTMHGLFYHCEKIEMLNLSNFDTTNVVDMNGMFAYCYKLENLNIDNFDTSKVTNMEGMFADCSSLKQLNVSNFDTTKVTTMHLMFFGCENLTTLNVSNFNTSNVTDMKSMFGNCSNLTELNLSNFNTSKVTNMSGMFNVCSNLTELDLSNFNTTNVTDMSYMFAVCKNLTSLNISNFKTHNVLNFAYMFNDLENLKQLDISSFELSKIEDGTEMFSYMTSLENIYVNTSNWNADIFENITTTDMFINDIYLPNYTKNTVDGSKAYVGTNGYLTDINQKTTLDLLPPFEIPDGFISGKSFIIFEMPDFEEITNQAIENTPENTEFYGWLIENEMAQQIFEPEDAEYILEDTYSYGEKVELRLTPIYQVLKVEKEVTEVLDGNNSVYDINNPESLIFRSEAPLAELESVEINGIELIKDTDYTATEGSTIITLSKDYLSTLKIGSYTISIISTNMIANATFKVEKVEEKNIKNISFNIEQLFNIEIAEFVDLEDDYIEIEEDLELEFVLEEDYVLYKDIEILIDDNSYILNLTDEEQELEGINFNSRKSILTIAYDLFENNSTLTIKAHALKNIPLDELVSEQEISITEFTNSEDLYEMIELSENEEFLGWLINKDELEIHNIVLQDNLTDILTKIYGEQIEQEESINSLDTVLEDVVLPGDELVAPEEELITTTLKPVLRITENKQVKIDLSEYVLGEMISVNDTIETFDELLTLAIENTPENTEFYGWFIEYFNNEEIISHDELSSTILAIFSNGEITDKSVNLTPLYVSVEQETTETEQPEEKVEESTDPEDVPQEEQIPENVEKEESSETPEENTSTEVEDDTTGNEPETDVNNSVEEIPSESIPTENTILINTDNLENISISNLNEDNTMSYTDNLTLKFKVEKDYKLPNTVEITIDKTYTINTNGENNPDGLEFNNSKITISTEYLIDIDTISINATAVLIEEQTEDETTSTDPEENVSKEPDKVEESTGTESTEQGTSQDEENPDEVTENKSSEKTEEESSTEIEESTNTGAEPETDANNSMENIPTETLPTEPEDTDISNDENISNIENPESSNNVENETITSEPTSLPENNFVPDNINSPENMTKAEEYIPVVKEMYESSKNLNEPNTSIQGLEHDIVLLKEPTKVSTKEEITEPTKNNVSDLGNVKENFAENTAKLSVSENSESSVTSVSVDKSVTVKDTITEPNKSATSTENSMPTTQNKTVKQKTVSESQTNNISNNSEKETSNSKSSEQTVNTTVKDTNVEKETSNKEE